MRRGFLLLAVLAAGAAVTLPAYASSPQTYVVTDLGDESEECQPPFTSGPLNWEIGTALNNNGDVVGVTQRNCNFPFDTLGFVWNHGTITRFLGSIGNGPFFPAFASAALAINDLGVAVGWSSLISDSGKTAVIWSPSGGFATTDIGTLAYGGPCPSPDVSTYTQCANTAFSSAMNIDNLGHVVGTSTFDTTSPFSFHRFYYDGTLHDNQGGLFSEPPLNVGTNSFGQSVSGRVEEDQPVFNATSGDPTVTRDGVVTHLNTVTPMGSIPLIDAADINDHGQITGSALSTDCFVTYGCIRAIHPYLLTDESPPSCTLTGSGTNALGQKYINVTVQDTLSGLQSIAATKLTNATMTLPAWKVGTPRPVIVTATKLDQSLSSVIALQATDIGGNVVSCDPALVVTVRTAGAPETQSASGLASTERFVTIMNDDPGVSTLALVVNGRAQQVVHLSAGERQTVDIGAALTAGQNTLQVSARGKPGGSALVTVSDTAPNS